MDVRLRLGEVDRVAVLDWIRLPENVGVIIVGEVCPTTSPVPVPGVRAAGVVQVICAPVPAEVRT